MDENTARGKKVKLLHILKGLHSLMVAFSGGVDSTFLLALSHQTLGDNVIAATADSLTYTSRERDEAIRFTKERGIRHIVFQSDETNIPEFTDNHPDRCYHCKKSLARSLINMATERGIAHVAFASNLDDLRDYRPGMKAATEMGILSPLIEAQIDKEEIRFLSKEMGLPTWNKPAMACLASRIPYESPITKKKLRMIEQAEAFLAENGFKQFRVRHHGPLARIELEPSDINRATETDIRKRIVKRFKEIGFFFISIDLEGFISGSMNRVLINKQ